MDSDREPSVEPGTRVGLGRVVENRSALGHHEPEAGHEPGVEEASEDSFPASDPPSFPADAATPAGGGADQGTPRGPVDGDLPGTELPDPEERL